MAIRPGSGVPAPAPLPWVALARDLPRPLRRQSTASEGWRRIRRGAYAELAPADRWDSLRDRQLALIAAAHRQLTGHHVVSHESAALLWGLPMTPGSSRTHVIRRRPPSATAPADLVQHVMVLGHHDVVERDGILVTSLERTVVDCAMSADPRSGLILADAGLRRGLDRGAALDRLTDVATRRGKARALAVLTHADPGAESAGESAARHLVLAAGLPAPETQVRVETPDGTFWSDLGWPDWRVLAEYDGAGKYTATSGAADAVLRERRREVLLEREGWRVFRVTAADLAAPDATVRALLRLAPAGAADRLTPRPELRLTPAGRRPSASLRASGREVVRRTARSDAGGTK